ncbi:MULTISPECIES: bifunctional 2-polyprenyl-6-hydroxyphenol methylase/3-demethylubiquinol 3-O-methyltransferase UbiG [unclassified Polaromonas]|uniref:class I SAM-dependent methyltransferase n=1 Tax=unclassified Polaromonas TaxID=2638319 RepID=UPI0018CAB2FC|nr:MULTISPECIES: class I SAM-dependent methyltransferase [unclassified Polaromonas]MBG6071202.1 SAM-dependent methyltransferase [Polaromonas sp. CG_9.7]MBG6113202.1 SAM-dependent methyltransferase [Polaromonas sp. CG_9.2]MDH6185734.1 SAM-dependent methyltransferase [Polaromonas sp. CG_23.6]
MIVKKPDSDTFHADAAAPSSWVQRWSHLVTPGGVVLDVACGHGRHARWFHQQNHPVVLVDRSQAAIESIAIPSHACEAMVADIENGPWPFAGRQFDAVVVANYLWRPLMPTLLDSLAPGGVLIYETFTQGNETVGKPSRPDFLLRPGELLETCRTLRIVAFEEGFLEGPNGEKPRFVQRIAAVREVMDAMYSGGVLPVTASGPPRYPLS